MPSYNFNPLNLIRNWWSLIYLQFTFIGVVWDANHLECTTLTVSLACHPFVGWCCSKPRTAFRDLGLSSRTLGGRCNYQSNPLGYPLTDGATTRFTSMEWVKTFYITTSTFDVYLQIFAIVHEFFITHVVNFSGILFPTGQHETHAIGSACMLSNHFLVLQPAVSAEFIIQLWVTHHSTFLHCSPGSKFQCCSTIW